jgi:hypothetical protein
VASGKEIIMNGKKLNAIIGIIISGIISPENIGA